MGFRFRKSKSFGPFRVNLSKSGVGWSFGNKWFRYTKKQVEGHALQVLFREQGFLM